ncbi:MAG: DUF1266 domain-containing protein [Candidatus Rokubacteria bacterium]|nr:DUF1266 domain-containing protein [Candidatus Rokubacteria bacterium]MBI3827070.1 DUF1266 domain-containing protein [Candidatus Rokubacteria bacterium]
MTLAARLSAAVALAAAGALLPAAAAADATDPPTPHTWALSITALLFDRMDLLGGAPRTPENITRTRALLERAWGIRNRQDLLGALRWLETQGHRVPFDELGRALDGLPAERYQAALDRAGSAPDALNGILVARRHWARLGRRSLIGWDFGRHIALCRWGHLLEFLSEDETWDRIMPAAHRLQRTFTSWADYGDNYLTGREYWSADETASSGQRMRRRYEALLADADSPWRRHPWSMNLGVVR